jgi:hypothetical protein
MRLQPLPDKWNTGAAINAAWKRQQARLTTTTCNSPAICVRHDVVEAKPTPVILPDTPVNIPVDAVYTSSIPDTGKRFQSFLNIYKLQVKAGQAKPITVKKLGDVYILIDGSRRLAAARMLKMPTISAIVQEA